MPRALQHKRGASLAARGRRRHSVRHRVVPAWREESDDDAAAPRHSAGGRPLTIPLELEDAVAERLIEYSQADNSMCKSGVMTRVGNMAQKAGLVPQGKKWTPTKEWLNGFLDRHPDVTVTDAKPTSASSQGPHLHEALKCMFTDYRRVLDFLGLTHSNQGNCVWNMDETGERLDPREPVEVLADASIPVPQTQRHPTPHKRITLVTCGNGAGQLLVPAFIMPDEYVTGDVRDAAGPCPVLKAAAGVSNASTAAKVLRHFIDQMPRTGHHVLVLDGGGGHATYEAMAECQRLGVHVVRLVAASTRTTQPMDVTVNAPLKSSLDATLERVRAASGDRAHISPADMVRSMIEAHGRVPQTSVRSGFQRTGLWPPADDADGYVALVNASATALRQSIAARERAEAPVGRSVETRAQRDAAAAASAANRLAPAHRAALDEYFPGPNVEEFTVAPSSRTFDAAGMPYHLTSTTALELLYKRAHPDPTPAHTRGRRRGRGGQRGGEFHPGRGRGGARGRHPRPVHDDEPSRKRQRRERP